MMLFLFNVQLRNKYDDDDDEQRRRKQRAGDVTFTYQMTGLNRRPRGWAHAAVTAGRACTPNKERYRGFLRLKALLIAATVAPSKTRKALVGAR